MTKHKEGSTFIKMYVCVQFRNEFDRNSHIWLHASTLIITYLFLDSQDHDIRYIAQRALYLNSELNLDLITYKMGVVDRCVPCKTIE